MTGLTPEPERRAAERTRRRRVSLFGAVAAVSAASAIIAIAGLVFALITYSGRIDQIQKSRRQSAQDSCVLLRGLVLKATPPSRRAQAAAYIKATPLKDCHAYSLALLTTR